MEKKINYLQRNFDGIKEELLKFSNQYYPEIFDDFNDSSIGAWFIDLVSAVGDDLSYHTDRMGQETSIDSANLKSTVLNMARTNGLKIPGRKASTCEVEFSCELPINGTDTSKPNWDYAPIIQKTSIVSAGNYNFELTENLNFKEQFNSDGYSNRKYTPARDGNGNITGYTVTKSTIVVNGNTKVYKKVITSADLKPFMEVVLPEENVMNIESIIFKETSDFNDNPSIYEYYIDAEEYKMSSSSVMTYRFFETDSLADQWRFGCEPYVNGITYEVDKNYIDHPQVVDGDGNAVDENTTENLFYYKGKWRPLKQKFITEYTDNGYMKVIFGAGNNYEQLPSEQTPYGDYIASKIINNDMLGILPKEGWTMFILYRVGGGTSTNLGPNSINKISVANVEWNDATVDGNSKGKVINSLKVTNVSTALAGKDAPTTEEIKALMKYNTNAQNRAVTVKDYKTKLMQMPPKYGAPFRCSSIENNNKVELSILGLNSDGTLTDNIPSTLSNNIVEYMTHFKQINDYIEVRSGRIYNIGIAVDLFISKNYDTASVVSNVITKVKDYFDVSGRDMGEDIFVGDLEKEINTLDGVISIINLRIYAIRGNGYSNDECPLPTIVEGSTCDTTTQTTFKNGASNAKQIDLDAIDRVLYNDYNAMFEIKSDDDIEIRVKTI
jgi:hypothetical protein